MFDAKNVVVLSGGLVDVPEVNGTVARFRLAVDYAANEKGGENTSGYFQVKYFLSSDNPNATFVKNQIEAGNFKKGSSLQIVGRLVQDRWETETGEKRQSVTVVAESMTYAGSNTRKSADGDAEVTTEVPDSF